MCEPFRLRVAMPSPAMDRLIAIVSGQLDFSWQLGEMPDWHGEWLRAQSCAGPSRHNKMLTRMAREISEVERAMEWFAPPGREPRSPHLRHVLKTLRFWLREGVPGECFHWFLQIGLVDVESRWPEELARACRDWGSERSSAVNLIGWLRTANRPRTHALHSEWPLPEPDMPDDLAYIAQAVTFAVFLGDVVPCTARFIATVESGRPQVTTLDTVVDALENDWQAEALIHRLASDGVMVKPVPIGG